MKPMNHNKGQHGTVTPGVNRDMHAFTVTHCSFFVFKAFSTRWRPFLVQKTWTTTKDLGEEPTITTLLNLYNLELHSKYIPLHQQINIVLIP